MSTIPDLPPPGKSLDLTNLNDSTMQGIAQKINDQASTNNVGNVGSVDTIEDQLKTMQASGIKLTDSIIKLLEMGRPILSPPGPFDPKQMGGILISFKSQNEFENTGTINLWFSPNSLVAFITSYYEVLKMMQEGKRQEALLEVQQMAQFWQIAQEQGQIAYQIAQDQKEMFQKDAQAALAQGCCSMIAAAGTGLGTISKMWGGNWGISVMTAQGIQGIGEVAKGAFDFEKAAIQGEMGSKEQVKALLDALSKTTEQQWQNAGSAWRAYTDQWSQFVDQLVKMVDANMRAAPFTQ